MEYCSNCVYPFVSAVPASFDDSGVCSGCKVSGQKNEIDWASRLQALRDLILKNRNPESGYDCIIPVSGGKDSYFQTHLITKILGFKPLLITYHGNNFMEEGTRNLNRMREVFDVDHIIFKPSETVLKKLNRLAFKMMGDMNWHNHVGIYTYPAIMAVKYNIPVMIWGEHGRTEVGGMYNLNDFIEMTKKYVLEHASRGFTWEDMIEESEGLKENDLSFLKYPTDDELFDLEIRGLHLSNFVKWSPNENTKLIQKLYNWDGAGKSFDRTYRVMSNLDDMHENGVHDYLKFIKFGYGRATDHACKDIRSGEFDREKGVKMVEKYDHVKPSDIQRWLTYVDMSEEEFDKIADTFRDSRVWWIDKELWWKDSLHGSPKSYGKVSLDKSLWTKYLR